MDKVLIDLPNIRTLEEANNFSSSIDNILEGLFKLKNDNIEVMLSKSMNLSSSQMIKKILDDNKVILTDRASIEKVLNQIKAELKNFEIVKLTIAVTPTDNTINLIHNWIVNNLKKNVLLDIETDENIIGGVIISLEGVYKDLSVKNKLEEIFRTKRAEIISPILKK